MVGSVQRVRRDTVRWRGGWARLGPRRGAADVAQITVAASRPMPPAVIDHCLEALHRDGYSRVVTSALLPHDAAPFAASGFEPRETLHLLAHDLDEIPRGRVESRRFRESDRAAVLRVDELGFDEFWRFDESGLHDAISATPVHRTRVVTLDNELVAYSITGRSGDAGYLQRLAVDPARRRAGLGAGLVGDGLRWLHRHGVYRAYVNTQRGNVAAVGLYERCGFRHLPDPLTVLGRSL